MKVFGELEYADLHNLAADPAAGKIGRIFWNTTTLKVMLDDGAAVYAMLRNDGKIILGNDAAPGNNIRLHRGANATLQILLGSDITAEGTLSTALAKLSSKLESYTVALRPAFGNPGRLIWNSDVPQIEVDTGAAWAAVSSAGAPIPESQVINLVADLLLKADLASPTFTGTVTGNFSGPLTGNADTATALSADIPESRVTNLVADLAALASGVAGPIPEAQITGLVADLTAINTAIGLRAPINNPTFTGIVTGAFTGNLTGNADTATALSADIPESRVTNLVVDLGLKAPLASPTFTGTVVVPNNSFANAKLAQMAAHSYKGNNTAGLSDPIDLTATQLTAELNLFSDTLKGLVPLSGGGIINFLRADGTWSAVGTPSPLTTKGDIYGYSTVNARLPVGTDGQALIADAASALGIKWATPAASSPLTTKGDIYAFSTVNDRLPIGPNGYVHTADSTQALGSKWAAPQGNKNYALDSGFENNSVNGWTATGIATLTNGLPVTVGAGGAAFSSANGGRAKTANTAAPAIDATSAVRGVYALNLATTGVGLAGDGYISPAFTIDPADQAKVLSFKISYKNVLNTTPNFSGTKLNTYAIAIYDLVNNAWIIPAGAFNFVQSSGVGIAQGTIQTSSNMTSFQIFVYSPVAPVGASSLLLDDIYVGPQSLAFGPPMSDPTAYTAVFEGLGTVGVSTAFWERIGPNLRVIFTVTAGTNTAAAATISLPTGLAIDSARLGSSPEVGVLGASGTPFSGGIVAFSSQLGKVFFTASTIGFTSGVPGTTWGNGIVLGGSFTVPILGWSSNTVMSADSDQRIVAMQVSQAVPTATLTGSYSLLKFNSPNSLMDTHAGFSVSTGGYTCSGTGFYRVTASVTITGTFAATTYTAIAVGKNSTTTAVIAGQQIAGGSQGNASPVVAGTIFCNAGDILYPIGGSSATTPVIGSNPALNFFHVEKLQGPAVVAASEVVGLDATGIPTGSITGADTVVKYPTVNKDTHGMYSPTTGLIICPTPGFYAVDATIYVSAAGFTQGGATEISVWKNGAAYKKLIYRYEATSTASQGYHFVATVWANTGDTLGIYANASATTPIYGAGAAAYNSLGITKR